MISPFSFWAMVLAVLLANAVYDLVVTGLKREDDDDHDDFAV